jgi:Na+-transporting NADH:ubiquinone oxidoreductase subunit NqrB
VLLIKDIINKNIGIMSRVLLVYFTISNIFYFYLKMDSVIQYKYLTSYVVLALTGFISIRLGRPYTMYEARSGYSKEFGKSSLFIEVNVVITKIWATIYLINAIIELAGHNIMTIIIMNGLVIIGIILSIIIPGALPEV